VNIFLVEKQLTLFSIFLQRYPDLAASSLRRSRSRSPSPSLSVKSKTTNYTNHASNKNLDLYAQIPGRAVWTIQTASALWYIQQALLTANLLQEFRTNMQELRALQKAFDSYDTTLSGECSIQDLHFLLEVCNVMRVSYLSH
jgi:hypothetical protein